MIVDKQASWLSYALGFHHYQCYHCIFLKILPYFQIRCSRCSNLPLTSKASPIGPLLPKFPNWPLPWSAPTFFICYFRQQPQLLLEQMPNLIQICFLFPLLSPAAAVCYHVPPPLNTSLHNRSPQCKLCLLTSCLNFSVSLFCSSYHANSKGASAIVPSWMTLQLATWLYTKVCWCPLPTSYYIYTAPTYVPSSALYNSSINLHRS